MNTALERATAIKLSLRIWRMGWLSLLPFVGAVGWAINLTTLWHLRSLKYDWNPAKRRLITGLILSMLGLLFALVKIAFIFIRMSNID
jgi:hypothetical protein